MGKILASGLRDNVKIATKLPFWDVYKEQDMTSILDTQLKKLKTDRIDYYLLHSLNGKAWEKLLKLNVLNFIEKSLKSGKILNIGFSYHGDKDTFRTIIDAYPWIFTQIQFNYLDTNYQAGIAGVKYAYDKDISVVCMEPLRGGFLAKEPTEAIKNIWAESGKSWSPAEWSLRWILHHKQIVTLLSGMNEFAQVDENVKVVSNGKIGGLKDDELKRVKKVVKVCRSLNQIPCTKCNYCMPCPFGVQIPDCFDYYNNSQIGKQSNAKYFYMLTLGGLMSKAGNAGLCTSCGKCLPKCPQNIKIPQQMKKVKDEFEGFGYKFKKSFIKLFFIVRKTLKKMGLDNLTPN